jgi:Carboxypeptidase regulatory-like domain
LFLLPAMMWAQRPVGSVHGSTLDPNGVKISESKVQLHSVEHPPFVTNVRSGPQGQFQFTEIEPGWYILSAVAPGFREIVQAIRVEAGKDVDTGRLRLPVERNPLLKFETHVLTVCEALDGWDRYNLETVVLVGIFKSGTEENETLREDCTHQLKTGEVAWPNAIALSKAAAPPDKLREEIEKKRQQVFSGYPPGAQPRSERVVGLYGRLASLAGLTSVLCCSGSVETNIAPARLLGPSELSDFSVIR